MSKKKLFRYVNQNIKEV